MCHAYDHLSRLRRTEALRNLVQETRLAREQLIQPLFVHHGQNVVQEIKSMPGQYQLSINRLIERARELVDIGIVAVILFGIPEHKDATGSDATDENGLICRAVRALKQAVPGLLVITDVCFCEYTDHGHCGILQERDGCHILDHRLTCTYLCRQARVQALAGADMLAPSGMIDGAVRAIRQGLAEIGFEHIPIMSYAAKYASSMYGPFRDAAEGAPAFGDRRSHQLDPANAREALLEIETDIAEGADIVMVKPALAYLDIIQQARQRFDVPIAAYSVSGEYAMIKAAAEKGWLDERSVVEETLLAMRRAGADMMITYHAAEMARWMGP